MKVGTQKAILRIETCETFPKATVFVHNEFESTIPKERSKDGERYGTGATCIIPFYNRWQYLRIREVNDRGVCHDTKRLPAESVRIVEEYATAGSEIRIMDTNESRSPNTSVHQGLVCIYFVPGFVILCEEVIRHVSPPVMD
jgi:hypothetical protein